MKIPKLLEVPQTYKGPHYSQLGQDVLALAVTEFKRNGYFVEFGAMDGKYASNTYLLEKDYEWTGIVAEPAKVFHKDLTVNRSCTVDHRAVTDVTGNQVEFKEVDEQLGLSGVVEHFHDKDWAVKVRAQSQGPVYTVSTVSLNDLLEQHQAPSNIDYISIDTEGSEYLILKNFNFKKYSVGFFSVEHNNVDTVRTDIKELMEQNGYVRILSEQSEIDDWYVPIAYARTNAPEGTVI
jgi:FkbM family methyltransferase